MGYTARCNFAECTAPTYTRSTAEFAAAAWNAGVARLADSLPHNAHSPTEKSD